MNIFLSPYPSDIWSNLCQSLALGLSVLTGTPSTIYIGLVHIVHTIHSSSFRGVHRGVGMGRREF